MHPDMQRESGSAHSVSPQTPGGTSYLRTFESNVFNPMTPRKHLLYNLLASLFISDLSDVVGGNIL